MKILKFPTTSGPLLAFVSPERKRSLKIVTEEQEISIPHQAPVMALPNALLFPNALLPLYIHEERYRQMLAAALESDRMFCIAMMKPGCEVAATEDDFFHTGGLGLIRACVANPNGTSHLVLQGLMRVRFTSFLQITPYRIAELQPMISLAPQISETSDLVAQVLYLCEQIKTHGMEIPSGLQRQLTPANDPAVLTDLVTSTFVRDPMRRQRLLENVSVSERLRMLIDFLREQVG